MASWLQSLFAGRPGWMSALMVFSAYMAIIYVPWDFFIKPVAVDEEVWFGILFHGWAAKLLEPAHWAVYAAGAYGFRCMKSWMWPWASLYVWHLAFGMLIWNLLYGFEGFAGLMTGVVSFAAFAALALALWRARPLFQGEREPLAERYGGWALVTGASAGLGAEFARALARDGVSCVLTARREDRLHELADELSKLGPVETRVVSADLTDPDDVERLAAAVDDLDIGILVNNAGFGFYGKFAKQDVARLRDMVAINCAAPVVLTGRLLPRLRARGRSAILFTGSVAGHIPLPLHAVYSATKGFDRLFGEALAVELADDGIDVLVLEPGPVATEFQSNAGDVSGRGEAAAAVVAAAFEALGVQSSTIPGWKNWLRAVIGPRLLSRPLLAHLARDVMMEQVSDDMR
jgi:short-subunit dehydrogenase